MTDKRITRAHAEALAEELTAEGVSKTVVDCHDLAHWRARITFPSADECVAMATELLERRIQATAIAAARAEGRRAGLEEAERVVSDMIEYDDGAPKTAADQALIDAIGAIQCRRKLVEALSAISEGTALEAADGPSRKLDAEVAELATGRRVVWRHRAGEEPVPIFETGGDDPLCYTGSIDASETLKSGDAKIVLIERLHDDTICVSVRYSDGPVNRLVTGIHKIEAIARTIAWLKAR